LVVILSEVKDLARTAGRDLARCRCAWAQIPRCARD